MRQFCVVFSAGAIGALVSCVALWLLRHYGIMAELGVAIYPGIDANYLYPRIVWGGLWGMLFLLPLFPAAIWRKSLVLSVFPTLLQLLFFYPRDGFGWLGLELGLLTPFVIWLGYIIWALLTGSVIRKAR